MSNSIHYQVPIPSEADDILPLVEMWSLTVVFDILGIEILWIFDSMDYGSFSMSNQKNI